MSTSNSQQILDTTEPLRDVKPAIRPKPLVPPRPKEITGSESKSPLISPTCSPCSPTLDIPSALKISQLTGPQPYGTRRTSLKRWSSSVGEDQENNPLSPVDNRSIDLPTKITAQPLSAPLKPTAPVWKGKSPFMLTTRGWGEQRWNQSRDHYESEAASQKPSSSLESKDTDPQKREITAVEKSTVSTSKSYNRIIPQEKNVSTNGQDSIASPEKLPSRLFEDVKVVSSGFGSNRPVQITEFQTQSSDSLQSDLHFESIKQFSQYDHKDEIMVPSTGSKTEKKVPSVPIRESLRVSKSQTEDENVKNTIVYDNHIPGVGLGLRDDISVDQGHLEKRNKNHQSEAHLHPHDLQQIEDVIPQQYTQHPNKVSEQISKHYDEQQCVTLERTPPKPKERKKPSVQFNVPKSDDQAEESLNYTHSKSEKQETKEYRQKEDGNEDMRKWHREDGMEEKSTKKTDEESGEEKQEKSSKRDEPQITNYTITTDDGSCREDDFTGYAASSRIERHDTPIQENVDVGQPDVHGLSFHHKEMKLTDEEEHSISYTTKLHERVEHGSQDVDTKQTDTHIDEDIKNFNKGHPKVEVKHLEYMPHFSHTPLDSSLTARSEFGNDTYSSQDSRTPYVHLYKSSTVDHTEFHENTDKMEAPHMSIESQSEDKLPSQEIYSHSKEFHPSSDQGQPQEELTLKNYEPKSSMSTLSYVEELESSKEFNLSNFEDPSSRVIHRDHNDGIQYSTIYPQNVQDGEKIKHGADESEDHHYWHSHLEEPLHKHAQSEELVQTYAPSEEPVHTYAQSKEPVDKYAPSEETVDRYAPSEEPFYKYAPSEETVDTYAPSEKLVYTYAQSEESMQGNLQEKSHKHAASNKACYAYDKPEKLVYTCKQPEEPVHHNIQSEGESHRYAVLKKAECESDQTEELDQTYEQPEEPISYNVQPEELSYRDTPSKTPTLTYEQSEKLVNTYDQLKDSCPQDIQLKEPEKVHEHVEKTFQKYVQPEDPPEKIIPHVKQSDDLYYQQTQAEELVSRNYSAIENISNEIPSDFSKYQQAQSEEPDYQQEEYEEPNYLQALPKRPIYEQPPSEDYHQTQSKDPNYQQDLSEEPNQQDLSEEPSYQQDLSDEPNYQQDSEESNYQQEDIEESHDYHKQSEESYYQQKHSEEPNYKLEQSEEFYYQQKHSEEQNYKQEQSEEPNYQEAQTEEPNYQTTHSEELDFRYAQTKNLDYKDKSSEDLHIRHYSEQSQQQDVQTPEGKIKMFEENDHSFTKSTEEEHVNLHTVETDSGHVTSAEQAESRTENFLEQQHRDSSPEEYHHKDNSTSETYHMELLSKEQDLRHAQQEEPKTLDVHTVELEHRDVLPEQQEHIDSKVTNRGYSSHESYTEESREIQAEDRMARHKNINGHSKPEESECSEDRSGEPTFSDEIHEQSPWETASDTEETPEENNFDFLEGTSVLDTSLMRGKASLGKKRCHKTPVTGTCTSQEEADPEYWMFRDSTEPRSSPKKDSDKEEREETSPDCTPESSPSSAKSPTKKGGLFSGIISPSILKGRRKSRHKTSEDEATKTETKESQEPTSPGKDKSESSSHSLNWLQALKKKKKKQPK